MKFQILIPYKSEQCQYYGTHRARHFEDKLCIRAHCEVSFKGLNIAAIGCASLRYDVVLHV